MATPPVSDDELRRTHDAFIECDSNQTKAAKLLGISRKSVQRRVRQFRERGLHLSDGGREAMSRVSLNGVEITGGYRHFYDEEGKKLETVRWSAPKEENAIEDFIAKVKDAFSDIPKAPPIPAPKNTVSDLLTLYPVFDLHYGMHAWGLETGYDDYDIKLAASDLDNSVGRVMALSPNSESAIVLIGGDFFHGDDNTNQTPKSRNPLDVDGRHYKVLDTGIELVATLIDRVASKHKNVTVRVIRGNHDERSHMTLTLSLAQRYRGHDRIKVEKSPMDLFMFQWGKCLIAAHHGDKQRPEQLAMVLAEVCPFWSASPFRIVFTGHRHSQQSEDFPGIVWERLRAFCPPDAFGAQFAPRRAMHAITFNKNSGIATRAQDPILRTA